MKSMELRELVNREIKATIVPELRKYNFKESFPHFRRTHKDGKFDYLSFQFNKYGGSFIVELASAYPYKGWEGNFYYWKEITPEFLKKSHYGYTKERLRLKPDGEDWFQFDEQNYKKTVESALEKILVNLNYFDKKL